ncbi:hypothetical protein Pmani_012490 [Petrolisthes manimaculis]|uniref:Uncharacterized protein n=1 Tax=Petrolisthes manimaculis TaxID=1843537 RepID=A0AAE1PYJ1_9EUCA|nr:hypothetical protein Pmani_012490 [Petrolisthes manimaculis]
MAYSGPATLAEVEADLNLSEEEDIADKHWPPLKLHSQMPVPTPWQPQVNTSYPASHPTTSTSSKRPVSLDSDDDKCGWCAGSHPSRTCPHRTPSQPTSNDPLSPSEQPLPTPDKSMWKCPRCHEHGVSVWHGCTRRSHTASAYAPTVPTLASLPPPPPTQHQLTHSLRPTESAEIVALRKAVAALESRCTALTARFDTIDARFDSLISQQATTTSRLDTLVEAQQVVIASVASLTERLDAVASQLERVIGLVPAQPPTPGTSSGSVSSMTTTSSVSRRPKGKLR